MKYTTTEINIFILSIAILVPSFAIIFISNNDAIQWTCIIASVISAAEIIFIIAYREYMDDNPKIKNNTDFPHHGIIAIGIVKFASIFMACITLIFVSFIIALIYEFIKSILLPILPYVALPILIFISLVLVNRVVVNSIYKKSK